MHYIVYLYALRASGRHHFRQTTHHHRHQQRHRQLHLHRQRHHRHRLQQTNQKIKPPRKTPKPTKIVRVEKTSLSAKIPRRTLRRSDDAKSSKDDKSKAGEGDDMELAWRQFIMLLGSVAFVGTAGYMFVNSANTVNKEMTFIEFRNRFLEPGVVEKLIVDTQKKRVGVVVKPDERPSGMSQLKDTPLHYFSIGSVEAFENELRDAQKELGINPRNYVPVRYEDNASLSHVFNFVFQLVLFGSLIYFMRSAMSGLGGGSRGGSRSGGMRNIFSIGRSPATVVKPGELTKVTFADVAGLDDAKG